MLLSGSRLPGARFELVAPLRYSSHILVYTQEYYHRVIMRLGFFGKAVLETLSSQGCVSVFLLVVPQPTILLDPEKQNRGWKK